MKVIVTGSRNIVDYGTVIDAIYGSEFVIAELVCGCASGVDTLGAEWAVCRGVPIKDFPADRKTHGKAASIMRNMEMAKYADALIAVWDGKSKVTENMILEAHREGLKVYVHMVRGN